MKKLVSLILAALMLLSLAACGKKDPSDLSQYKTKRISNTSKVTAIAQNQPLPAGYTYNRVEIQSKQKPYSLTIYLNAADGAIPDFTGLTNESYEIFKLIGNLGVLIYKDAATGEELVRYVRPEQ